ncbi:ParB family chromosome partitioning protein [Endobacter medicaginis]|uniref:ParB N-terminal domain-containing protein n=1 Tax=Endobacter medicaginis TaxID=1181271 RepID=A0A850NMD2_9PROT|nr:ParB/RepB/Spo0J family partition protein [Endobacter medicaginis]MBB3175585.1 ParB family chromosome partitioning protein [Endobacter medicaginis]MCX5476267.1 ParB N-terminal domain-containing protein [Endobacter medicaginis]NVN30733.1 ParB N-terminal domain-containing protein [Endobacter medicaginis]
MAVEKIKIEPNSIPVPLDKLLADPRNVRHGFPDSGIAHLADDLAMNGLLQNLVVRHETSDNGEPTGRYFVTAGRRRHSALKHLVKNKRLAKNAAIPCRVTTEEDAGTISLIENISRVAMHPADQFQAFAALSDEGKSIEQIALRFGITTATVERRLRLGRLAPIILSAYRDGLLKEDEAKAFAVTVDQETQARAFDQFRWPSSWSQARSIRSMLTEGEIDNDDARAVYVGADAYEAAGGAMTRDLFSDHVSFGSAELLNRLALEKLEAFADSVRAEGWAKVLVRIEAPAPVELTDFERAFPSEQVGLSAEDAQREADLTARREALEVLDEMTDEQADEIETIDSDLERLAERAVRYAADDLASGLAIVSLNEHSGQPTVRRLKPRAVVQARPSLPGADQSTGNVQEPDKKGLTAALTASLLAHRTRALQAHVAQRPGLALRLLAQALLIERSRLYSTAPLGLRLRHPDTLPPDAAKETQDGAARRVLDEAHEQREDHQPGDEDGLLPWLLAMDDWQVVDLIAPLVAEGIDAGASDWTEEPDCLAAQVARAAEYDPRPYWTADAETYFGRVNKEQIAQAVTEAGGSISTAGKKGDLVIEATRKVADTGWLPALLRPPAPTSQD